MGENTAINLERERNRRLQVRERAIFFRYIMTSLDYRLCEQMASITTVLINL